MVTMNNIPQNTGDSEFLMVGEVVELAQYLHLVKDPETRQNINKSIDVVLEFISNLDLKGYISTEM